MLLIFDVTCNHSRHLLRNFHQFIEFFFYKKKCVYSKIILQEIYEKIRSELKNFEIPKHIQKYNLIKFCENVYVIKQ